jgi:hypothetical protein
MRPDEVTNGLADTNGVLVLLTELLELVESLEVELVDAKGDPETVLLLITVDVSVVYPDVLTIGLDDCIGLLVSEGYTVGDGNTDTDGVPLVLNVTLSLLILDIVTIGVIEFVNTDDSLIVTCDVGVIVNILLSELVLLADEDNDAIAEGVLCGVLVLDEVKLLVPDVDTVEVFELEIDPVLDEDAYDDFVLGKERLPDTDTLDVFVLVLLALEHPDNDEVLELVVVAVDVLLIVLVLELVLLDDDDADTEELSEFDILDEDIPEFVVYDV